MRVLHVADRLTDRGGAYQHLLGVLGRQSAQHELHLAVGHDDGSVTAPCEHTLVPALAARGREPVDLRSLITKVTPDVVHVHNVMNPSALESLGALPDVGRVLTVQDHRVFCPGRGKWTASAERCVDAMSKELCAQCFSDDAYYDDIYALTEERRAALARFQVIVLSQYMKRELGLDRAYVIPPFVHGLDYDAAPSGPPCVLFVGRLVEAKGVRDAVAAWKRSGVALPLVFAGTGLLRAELVARGDVEVLGWVPHERVSGLYRRAAALVMPSRWQEPYGIVGLEARSMGVPVAAWESGGVAEWHPGPLAPWGDVDTLARILAKCIGAESVPLPSRSDEPMEELEDVYDLATDAAWRGPGGGSVRSRS